MPAHTCRYELRELVMNCSWLRVVTPIHELPPVGPYANYHVREERHSKSHVINKDDNADDIVVNYDTNTMNWTLANTENKEYDVYINSIKKMTTRVVSSIPTATMKRVTSSLFFLVRILQ